MKLSSYRRLYNQDFDAEYADLVDQLGITINTSFEELYESLNNKLSISDNINATIIEISVTVKEDGTPKNNTQFKLRSGQTTFEGIMVISAIGEKSSPSSPILPNSGVYVYAIKSENNILVKNIKGLNKDIPYKLKLVAFG